MPQENSNDHNNLQKVHNPMTLINPLEGNFFDNRPGDKAGNARNGAGPGGRRSKDPMEDILGSMEATVPLIWELDLELLTVWTMTMTHQILQIPPGKITFEFF